MQITKINNTNKNNNIHFKGPLDGVLTSTLQTLDTNQMVNAVGIDLFAMVGPRSYIDTKERNKYAGAETFTREIMGTFINCLSAAIFAKGISIAANKIINPNVKLNTKSWFTNDTIGYLAKNWDVAHNTDGYVKGIFNNIENIPTRQNIEWIDKDKWTKFTWDNPKFNQIHEKLKDKNSIYKTIETLITDKTITKSDSKKLKEILSLRLVNLFGKDNVSAKIGDKTLTTTINNLLRDSVDLGRDVLTNAKINPQEAITKILKINKVKTVGAVTLASVLGLTNQYVNRKITEKRTGVKGFVGDTNYENNVQNKKSTKDNSKSFWTQKILASAGMIAMAIGVMKVKSPAQFMKKLEFTGPITSGNVIKTVYASNLVGRFLASDNKDELRETVTRDYFGFLNWLVLGGFAAKGMANMLDKNRENLFHINKDGKGIKHWLNDITLKSHNEIAVQGHAFAKRNMWKLNVAHITGLAYSTIMLGVLLPKINIWMTKHKQQKQQLKTVA